MADVGRTLARRRCGALASIGCGGRLDLERTLAMQFNLRIDAYDILDPRWVVDEGITYNQVHNSHDAVAVPPPAALLFCWGTHAPWRAYLEAYKGNTLLIFSGVDDRVKSHPNPCDSQDVEFINSLGFAMESDRIFKGPDFWLSECRFTCFVQGGTGAKPGKRESAPEHTSKDGWAYRDGTGRCTVL